MSRIGKKPILIPAGVEAKLEAGKVQVKGPKGELSLLVRPEIKVELTGSEIRLSPQLDTKGTAAFWGLSRALIFNMVKGVTEGFEKKLEIQGVGFKALVEGNTLVLNMGFSHQVKMPIPENIKIAVDKNIISVSGADKFLVGETTALIRKVKPPEPYKGKGIRYLGEVVRRKVGKKVVASKG